MVRLSYLRRAATAMLVAAVVLPATAQAATSWVPLPGLQPDAGANWPRFFFNTISDPFTIYAGDEDGGVFRSTNDGLSWSALNSGLDPSLGAQHVRTIYSAGSILAGTNPGLYSLSGSSWSPLAQGPEDDPQHPKKLNLSVQALYKPTGGPLLAGTFSGGVYSSNDNGQTWTPPAPGNGMPAGETVWDLTSLAPNAVFAATSSGIYRSLNFGSTWTPAGDGIAGTAFKIFTDSINPLIYYAGTGDGFFRSINGGITWAAESGPAGHTIGNGPVRSMVQFGDGSSKETRVYATTYGGLYAGTSSNNTSGGVIPGPLRWRHITDSGLGGHTEMWALSSFTQAGKALMAGTHGGGGFVLLFSPPVNTVAPAITSPATVIVGSTAHTSNGTWGGTPTIDYSYAWQDCGTTNTCPDLQTGATIDDAEDNDFIVPSSLQNHYIRAIVTAENDFPTFGRVKAATATKLVNANPNTLPGANQSSTASITVPAPGDSSLPQSGDTLHSSNGLFNPAATSYKYTWIRCGENAVTDADASCKAFVVNASSPDLVLTDDDVTHRFCVQVTGTNTNGSKTLGCSGLTNTIFPLQATSVKAPAIFGTAYVGESLTGNVGQWTPGSTTYKRHWEQCSADGGSCSYISGQTGPSYTPTADDVGHTLRLLVTADSNEDNHFPGPTDAESAPTAVVTNPPPPPAPPGGGGGGTTTTPTTTTTTPGVTPPPLTPVIPTTLSVSAPKVLKLGSKLKAPASIAGVIRIRYQWQRNKKAIKHATKRTYKLTRKDRGKKIRCKVTLTLANGTKLVRYTKTIKVPRRLRR